jgi:hypothetical protein
MVGNFEYLWIGFLSSARTMAEVVASNAQRMSELCDLSELDDDARALLRPEQSITEFVAKLLEHKLVASAIAIIGQALNPPTAVAWALRCVRSGYGDSVPARASPLIEATERWVQQPGELQRREAYAAAERGEPGTAAHCSALAAFFSGGSLAPSGLATVPVPIGLCGKMVRFAILLAAVVDAPERAEEKLLAFANDGLRCIAVEER